MILFNYILKEILPQFVSNLIVFCALIVISQLVRLSHVLVTFGLTLENIFLPFLYIILPFMPIIIPISFLFSVMVSLARLSSDGEFTAMVACGYSMQRILRPIACVSLALYALSVLCAVNLEAWGRREFVQFIYRKSQTELDNMMRFKIQPGVFVNDFLDYTIYTERISKDRSQFYNVVLAPDHNSKQNDFVMVAPRAKIEGSVEMGNLHMTFYDGIGYSTDDSGEGSAVMRFAEAEIDVLRIFHEQILGPDSKKDDYRSYPALKLYQYVKALEADPKGDRTLYQKAAYLWHARIANPFLVIVFAFLGLLLGIGDQRQNKNAGYIGTVLAVICCFVFVMSFRWLAENGWLQPWVGAWLPQLILASVVLLAFRRKVSLPLSESLFQLPPRGQA